MKLDEGMEFRNMYSKRPEISIAFFIPSRYINGTKHKHVKINGIIIGTKEKAIGELIELEKQINSFGELLIQIEKRRRKLNFMLQNEHFCCNSKIEE